MGKILIDYLAADLLNPLLVVDIQRGADSLNSVGVGVAAKARNKPPPHIAMSAVEKEKVGRDVCCAGSIRAQKRFSGHLADKAIGVIRVDTLENKVNII